MSGARLLLIHTGGTLGMLPEGDPGPLAPSSYAENLLPWVPGLEERYEISGELMCNVDSSDMVPDQWEELAGIIRARMEEFDGFVVLHGTDTMAYTASALSFLLRDLPKPVVLTGSQRPVSELRTDAKTNLIQSAICASLGIPEVSLYFGAHLFRGNCATKSSVQSYEAFSSPNLPPLVEFGVDLRQITTPLAPSAPFSLQSGFNRKVMVLYLFPGIRPGQLTALLDAGAKGIVLLGFGSGNVPQQGWPEAIAEATERGVPVVIRSQSLIGDTLLERYQGGAAASAAGALSALSLTVETTIVRTMFLLHQFPEAAEFRSAWKNTYAGEW